MRGDEAEGNSHDPSRPEIPLNRKTKRPPNCAVRAEFAWEVIVPKLLLVADDTAGAAKLA